MISSMHLQGVGKNSGPWHQWSQKVFQVSRKNEKEKVKVINTEKWKNGKSIFVKIARLS